MKMEISNGELIDKTTILEIKLLRISDSVKKANIEREYSEIKPLADQLMPMIGSLYEQLAEINRTLWTIEDRLREFEKKHAFGQDFIEAARSVYRLNDERSGIKREINRITGSAISEEKSYTAY